MVGGVTEGVKTTEVDPINIVEGPRRRTSTRRALDEECHMQLLEDAEELQEYMMAEDGELDELVESGTESPESQGTVGATIRYAMPCHAMPCNAMQSNTIQYYKLC